MKIKLTKCQRCGYEWVARIEHPVKCPHCQSPYWKRPKRKKEE